MKNQTPRKSTWGWPVCLIALTLVDLDWCRAEDATDKSTAQGLARAILDTAGIPGGLIVHLGCGDGKLTAALHINDSYLVQGLDADDQDIEAARKHIQSLGLGGQVSVATWSGQHLPYIDNLVNLVVGETLGEIPRDEVMRVLAPGGVAYLKTAGNWSKTLKRRPQELDDWTHYLHDAGGDAVSHDTVVGPPRHLQWVGSPTWTRHHDHMSSFNAMVSAGGRVFYILDEGLRAEIQLPPKWAVIARDAFNGTLLWKRSIDDWHVHLWPAKSGPAQLPRRLVAIGNTVFVTLGLDAPVTALDAATGQTIRTYEQTQATEEILCSQGVLFALVNPQPASRPWSTKASYPNIGELRAEVDAWAWDGSQRSLVAVAVDTGSVLWKTKTPVVPLTLAVDDAGVFFHDGAKVVCLDRKTGQSVWTSPPTARAAEIRSWFAPTLVVYQDVVVFAGADQMVRHSGAKDKMTALSAKTGEVLWSAEHPPSGYDSPEDLLIIDGLVWTAPLTNRRDSGEFVGRDVHTGEVKRTVPSDYGDPMPHHRCHRAKATDKYILASRTGIDYVDLDAEHWDRNDWVRGACLYGILPANGLTYAPPHSCACYILAKLNGLNALAPRRQTDSGVTNASNSVRLQPGSAYAPSAGPPPAIPDPQDWPTYRHDESRSGFTSAAMPAELKRAWEIQLGGKLSSLVVGAGKVLVAAVDQHTVHAIDRRTGIPQWQYTAGGRVDSPPTVWRDRVLFGSHDGYVYCLRVGDGALAWRFRAAPTDEQLVAFEQVESVWPVHGSVLVHEGIVHCVAGRSMFLDGGMRYLRLDAATGKLVSETVLDNRNPTTGKALDADIKWPNLPVALPDILSCDGQHVYMRSQVFDLQGERTEVVAPTDFKDQTGPTAHLFCNTGFLDDSWWHRSVWIYGKNALSGAGNWYTAAFRTPAGRIMACDDQRVYAFDRQPQYYPSTTALEYHVYAANKQPKILGGDAPAKSKPNRPVPSRPIYDWSYQTPVLGRALVLAGQTLFVAGPPDVVDEEQTLTEFDTEQTRNSLTEQSAAYEGKQGSYLLAMSAADGKKLAAYRLTSMPVFDGMAAAHGCLYLSTTDGKVVCLGGEGEPLEAATDVTPKEPAGTTRARSGLAVTTNHPDFQQLSQVKVTAIEHGWRLQVAPGSVGFALQKLATPLTQQATFKFQLHMIPKDTSADPPRNGFLLFGDVPDEPNLIKCGMRRKQGLIVEGPYAQAKNVGKLLEAAVDETCNVVVAVDLHAQTVTMTIHGQTITTKLNRRLESIQFVGYCANSVTAEFSAIETSGR